MTEPDPEKEPESETTEKKGILKTHEEFIDNQKPSLTRQEYEKQKERERQKGRQEDPPADR